MSEHQVPPPRAASDIDYESTALTEPEPDDAHLNEVLEETLRRRRALEGMWSFREYLAPCDHQDVVHPPAAHHHLLIHHLEDLLSPDTFTSRLLVMAPPGSAKSTYASIQLACWALARNPAIKILACSNTSNLAEEFNKRRRQICDTAEWQALSGTSLDPSSRAAASFYTSVGGGCRAAGVGAAIAGFRADLTIVDDPISNFEEAQNDDQLDKQWAWYNADLRTRLRKNGVELVIMTRWARNDLAGRILRQIESGEEKDWKVVRLPLVADRDDDPLGRKIGERLWPEWYSDQREQEARRDPQQWAGLWQQRPLAESGEWVAERHIQTTVTPPYVWSDRPGLQYSYKDKNEFGCMVGACKWIVSIDLALTVGKGDYSVVMVAGLAEDGAIHIAHVYRARVDFPELTDEIIRIWGAFRPELTLIEDDSASKAFVRYLGDRARQRQVPVNLTLMPIAGKKKEQRAAAIRGYFQQDRVFIRGRQPWTNALIEEVLEFPYGRHDDTVDCLGMIGNKVMAIAPPDLSTYKDARRDKLLDNEVIKTGDGEFLYPKTFDWMFEELEKPKRKYQKLRMDGR